MQNKIITIKEEVQKAIIGKNNVIEQVLMAILAKGHILLEDIPGVGKTTLALAFSNSMGLAFNRIQFTPDVVPSDITGFSMYDKKTGEFKYMKGVAMCNMLLADEINRTSSKTQSSLLEVMQEGKMTVDGETHTTPKPFTVIATQNPLGTAGTQMLPEAQLDRFMIQISMGYPDKEAQINILKDRQKTNPLTQIKQGVSAEELIKMQGEVEDIYIDDKIYEYITNITENTREHQLIRLGISPRGALAMCSMARAKAYIENREYVIPEDVQSIAGITLCHRLILSPKAQMKDMDADNIIEEILNDTVCRI